MFKKYQEEKEMNPLYKDSKTPIIKMNEVIKVSEERNVWMKSFIDD